MNHERGPVGMGDLRLDEPVKLGVWVTRQQEVGATWEAHDNCQC